MSNTLLKLRKNKPLNGLLFHLVICDVICLGDSTGIDNALLLKCEILELLKNESL